MVSGPFLVLRASVVLTQGLMLLNPMLLKCHAKGVLSLDGELVRFLSFLGF